MSCTLSMSTYLLTDHLYYSSTVLYGTSLQIYFSKEMAEANMCNLNCKEGNDRRAEPFLVVGKAEKKNMGEYTTNAAAPGAGHGQLMGIGNQAKAVVCVHSLCRGFVLWRRNLGFVQGIKEALGQTADNAFVGDAARNTV